MVVTGPLLRESTLARLHKYAALSLLLAGSLFAPVALHAQSGRNYAWSGNGRYYQSGNGRFYRTTGQIYTTATSGLSESFGNQSINPTLCPDGSTVGCTQQWYLRQGAAPTITSASGTGCGFPASGGANVAQLTSSNGGTQSEFIAVGTFPLLVPSSGVVLTFSVCMSAYPATAVALVETLGPTGSNINFSINAHSTGFAPGPTGTTCAATAGVAHTIVATLNGSSSKMTIDGVQCGSTWTASANVIGALQFFGGTVGTYTTNIQALTMGSSASTGMSFPVQSVVDFIGQTGNTVNASNLQAGTQGGNAITGTATAGNWNASSLVGVSFSFVGDHCTLPGTVLLSGVAYNPQSTTALQMAATTTSSSTGYWKETLDSADGSPAAGFCMKWNSTGQITNAARLDVFGITGHNGAPIYDIQMWSDGTGTNWELCGENASNLPSSSSVCTSQTLSANTWYWVTFSLLPSGNNYFQVYDTVTFALLYQIAFTGTPQTNVPLDFTIEIGKVGSQTLTNSANVLYSNVIIAGAASGGIVLPVLQ